MSVLDVIIQGIIQGVTEFLPISSSGHLAVVQYVFGISSEESLFLTTVLHLGTLVAVFISFFDIIKRICIEVARIFIDIFKGRFSFKWLNGSRRLVFMLIVASIPLVGAYFLSSFVDRIMAYGNIIIVGICFIFTGILLFIASKKKKCNLFEEDMKVGDALLIGLTQMIAVLPGISRSGSTTSVGILRGFNKEFMVMFSFILGIPAILGAAASLFMDKTAESITVGTPLLIIGFLTSAVTGIVSIKLINFLVKKNRFTVFAWYLLIIGAATIIIRITEFTL